MAPDLTRPKSGETVDVLVHYATNPNDGDHRRVADRRGRLKTRFDHLPLAHYSVTSEALADLEQNPNVLSISPDRAVQGLLDHVGASANWTPYGNYINTTGHAVTGSMAIAVIDSGLNTSHPDFASWQTTTSFVVYSESFVGGDTLDHFGHGTHVAGIAAGADTIATQLGSGASRIFWGMVPYAKLVNLKVLEANGHGTDSAVIAAINRAIQLKRTYNIRVINLSLGRPIATS